MGKNVFKSCSKHYKYSNKKIGEESIKYPNKIKGNWKLTRPFEKVVSDTTIVCFKERAYDWTYYFDIFNGEIVGSDVRESKHGCNVQNHISALKEMLENKIKRGYRDLETVLNADQGAIYSSAIFNNILKNFFVTRSMSRVGTQTDNPIIESKNGWLKEKCILILI